MTGTARSGRMRRWTVLGCLVASSVGTQIASADFPYVAYVAQPDTLLRSGPDEEHYPTGKLTVGYAVEVYRHDGTHWCAIRPPAGEYCLAPVEALRLLADQTAEVLSPRTPARIGSQLTSSAHAVQVLLEAGEVVEVIQPPQPGDRWVKISPPAGEFRWVSAEHLARRPPVEADGNAALPLVGGAGSRWRAPGEKQHSESDATGNQFSHLVDEAILPVDHQTSSVAGNRVDLTGDASTDPTDQPIEIIPNSPADAQTPPVDLPTANLASGEQYQTTPPDRPVGTEAIAIPAEAMSREKPRVDAPEGTSATPSPPRVHFPGEEVALPVNTPVAELQFLLSQTVAQPPTDWDLTTLRAETAARLAQEQDTEARAQLRDLLDRVAVFEQVQRRYLDPPQTTFEPVARAASAEPVEGAVDIDLPASGGEAPLFTGETKTVRQRIASDVTQGMIGRVRDTTLAPGEAAVATGAPTVEADAAAPIEDDPFEEGEAKYDAVGTLKPVVSRRANAPRYALIDDQGDVAAFVSAAPDVHLSRYIGRRIGVQGTRGFMPDYRRSHVTATRVRTIGETKLR